MELKITKEKVLEAASKCSTAKATLETLFPECFEPESKYVDEIEDFFVSKQVDCNKFMFIGWTYVEHYILQKRCFILHNRYDWEIRKQSDGRLILIPTKK